MSESHQSHIKKKLSKTKTVKLTQRRIDKVMDKLMKEFPDLGEYSDGKYAPRITDVGFLIRQLYGKKGYGGEEAYVMFSTANVKKVWNRMKKYYKSRGYPTRKSKLPKSNTLLPTEYRTYFQKSIGGKNHGKSHPREFKVSSSSSSKESQAKSGKSRDCPEGKIRNPKTGRCINLDGAIGRKLNSGSFISSDDSIEKLRTKCPKGKILNPSTGRCVDEKGKIGKDILSRRQKLEIVSREEIIPIVISKAKPHKKIVASRRKI